MSPVDAYLPLGLTVEGLLAYTIGAVTFASVLVAWSALIEHRPAAARIQGRRAAKAGTPEPSGRRRATAATCPVAAGPCSHAGSSAASTASQPGREDT